MQINRVVFHKSIIRVLVTLYCSFGGVNLLHAATISDRLQSARVDDKLIAARVETVQKYISSLNTADIDQIVSLFSDNAVAIDPLGSTPVVGISKIRDFYMKGLFLHSIHAKLDGEVRVSGNSTGYSDIFLAPLYQKIDWQLLVVAISDINSRRLIVTEPLTSFLSHWTSLPSSQH